MDILNIDRFLLDSYTGQGGFMDGSYLVAHTRESEAKLAKRRGIATYPNYTRKVVNTYLSHLFQRPARRESPKAIWSAFSGNADNTGSSIDKVMRRATRLAMLLGTVALVVDRPRGQPRTYEEESRLRPYLSIRLPSSIAGVVLDEFGDIERITFSEVYRAPSSSVSLLPGTSGGRPVRSDVQFSGSGIPQPTYRTYHREGWYISDDPEGRVIRAEGSYRLEGVPVVWLHATEILTPGAWRAQSWAWDVAVENYNLFNLYSELREILRSQTFSLLTFPVIDAQEAQALRDGKLQVGTHSALIYNPSGGGQPSYISPEGANATIYLNEVTACLDRLYKQANLEFISGSVESSGIALAFRFQEANRTISDLGSMVEQAEREVAHYVCRWFGQDFEGTITYPTDFSVQDLQAELKNALDAVTLDIGPVFEGALKKKMARVVLGAGTDQDLLTEIDKEIDARALESDAVMRQRLEAIAQNALTPSAAEEQNDTGTEQEQGIAVPEPESMIRAMLR